jgi:hypothetical protein
VSAAETARAPRLTENRLADLDVAVATLNDEVAYLAECLSRYPKGDKLHERFSAKHGALSRARDWIAGKVAAERAQRAAGASSEEA